MGGHCPLRRPRSEGTTAGPGGIGRTRRRRQRRRRFGDDHHHPHRYRRHHRTCYHPSPFGQERGNTETLANAGQLRLGTITLRLDESQEIQLFDWAGQAAQAAAAACEEAISSRRRQQGQSQTIAKLQAQLDDLVQAKDEHETLLLERFRALLDSKKAKIRDQQRQLDEANGPAATTAMAAVADTATKDDDRSRRRTTTRKPAPSSTRKRKVAAAHMDPPDIDRPAPDETKAESAEDDVTQTTPEPLLDGDGDDDETTDEESDPAKKVSPPPPPSQTKGAILGLPSTRNPPPPRRLPFRDHVHHPSDLPPSERSPRLGPVTATSVAELAPTRDDDLDDVHHATDESGDDEL